MEKDTCRRMRPSLGCEKEYSGNECISEDYLQERFKGNTILVEPPAPILYEDNHLMVVNKKAGQIVQGDKTGDRPLSELLKDFIKVRDSKPGNVFLGVTHRLDRPVSGVIVFAKTGKALERMNALIRERKIRKTYWALTRGIPPQDRGYLVDYLYKNEQQNKSYVCEPERKGALRAELEYRLLEQSEKYCLLEVELHTGRHHQIRCQLSAIGCPIQGDLKYGDRRSNPDGSIALHARYLEFEHPVRKEWLKIEAPVPLVGAWKHFSIYGQEGLS